MQASLKGSNDNGTKILEQKVLLVKNAFAESLNALRNNQDELDNTIRNNLEV